jgi:hypothetical protein
VVDFSLCALRGMLFATNHGFPIRKTEAVMNSRKPKQNPEHVNELPSERLQLAEAVPSKKPEGFSLANRGTAPIVIVELQSPKPRTRLH